MCEPCLSRKIPKRAENIFPIQMDIFLLRASPPFLDTLTEFQLEHQPTTEGESGQQQLSGNALEHHHFRKGLLQRIAGEL
jgi:hypothetical protein